MKDKFVITDILYKYMLLCLIFLKYSNDNPFASFRKFHLYGIGIYTKFDSLNNNS